MNDRQVVTMIFEIFNNEEADIKLEERSDDGRLNSALSEKNVADYITDILQENEIRYSLPQKREWYDIQIEDTPFNIKITDGATADNCSSKKGLGYCLTGKVLKGQMHQPLIDLIGHETTINNYDYGFIVYNKRTKRIYISSLKNISPSLLVPNGNNLPFQIKFGLLDDTLNHSDKKQEKILIDVFLQSWKKKVNVDLEPLERILNAMEEKENVA